MLLNRCTAEDLDARARRAEHQLNLARQARQWHLADRYRQEMRAIAAECERRHRDSGDQPGLSAVLRAEAGPAQRR
ncbi:hypothetical protein ABT337_11510 [Saccharopolyspora hirsuta]|uniref:Uncharacterized protein n=1 Tax=Saccharopolyspora hirsuta TaxID=1837 RepID=A0A5M7BZ27_SACHI|nr:hypothetical protein [Saccharopolyspora hirsuta]KAA5834410.1 hypothetical protein F1721_12035 [Saccharopolyspora hirsuta]